MEIELILDTIQQRSKAILYQVPPLLLAANNYLSIGGLTGTAERTVTE